VKHVLRWFACLLFALAACAGEAPNPPSASSADAAACEESDSASFLSRFVADIEFQRQATKSPLLERVIDDDLEPKESLVTKSAEEFPLLPSPAQIKAQGLVLENIETDRGMQVRLYKPETDYLIYYEFERVPCWTLVRIENQSL
jgi:hypothetical protein